MLHSHLDTHKVKRAFVLTISVILLQVVLFIYSPMKILYNHSDLLKLDALYTLTVLIILSFIVSAVAFVFFLFVNGKIANFSSYIAFLLAIALFVNGEFNTDLSNMLQGYTHFWPDQRWNVLVNLLLWVAFMVGGVILLKHQGRIVQKITTYLALVISLVLIVESLLFMKNIAKSSASEPTYYMTTDYIDSVSSEKNIFIFVLDCLDGDYIEEIVSETPDFFEELTGFTNYTNATSVYSRTIPSFITMLSEDYENVYSVPFSDYYNLAWKNERLFSSLAESEYEINYYDDMTEIFENSGIPDSYFKNFSNQLGDKKYSIVQTIEKMLALTVYRNFPTVFQPYFEQTADDVNNAVVISNGQTNQFGFYSGSALLRNMNSLMVCSEKQFKLFHIDGAHPPYTYDEEGNYTNDGLTAVQEARGNLKAVFNYIQLLKDYNVYDNSEIFIIADHGFWVDSSKPLKKPTTIMFFHKSINQSGDLVESDLPVSLRCVVPTILEAVSGELYFTINNSLSDLSSDDDRIYYKSVNVDGEEVFLYEYKITGNARYFENYDNTNIYALNSIIED